MSLTNEGQYNRLESYFRASNSPTGFSAMLFDSVPTKSSTLADLQGEPSGSGYARQTIERSSVGWPSIQMSSGNYKIISRAVLFLGSGTPSAVALITDHASPLLVAYAIVDEITLSDTTAVSIQFEITEA